MRGYMPFPNAELRIPSEFQNEMEMYTRTRPGGGDRPDPQDAPLPRQVDMWFLAVCLGAATGQRVALAANKSHKFNTASIFDNDESRVELLELLAIAVEDDPYVIKEPRRVIEVANELAAGGLPILVDMLKEGQGPAIEHITQNLLTRLGEAGKVATETL